MEEPWKCYFEVNNKSTEDVLENNGDLLAISLFSIGYFEEHPSIKTNLLGFIEKPFALRSI